MTDIAHSLAHQCRFVGHVRTHYSVAEHSVRASKLIKGLGPRLMRLAALLHDAHESYLGDLSAPLKATMPTAVREWWKYMERIHDTAIAEWANLPLELLSAGDVKEVDLTMLAWEIRDLRVPPGKATVCGGGRVWKPSELPRPPEEILIPWPAEVARYRFIKEFLHLSDGG